MRQIHTSLSIYATDHDGWYPMVTWSFAQVLCINTVEQSWGEWIPQYFPNLAVLRCPAADPRVITDPGWWAYQPPFDQSCGWSTYRIIAARGSHPLTDFFYGWPLYVMPDAGESGTGLGGLTVRGPCPRVEFAGNTVPSYYGNAVAVAPPAQQPAIVDCYEPSGTWLPYGNASRVNNNHAKLNGMNVVYVDGHGEWHNASQVKYVFQLYGGQGVYW
jgi:prepilin-type processing-associated H-X9-DG protein